jgi:hypothetical protein
MSFKMQFETDNAAFEGDPAPEIARILRQTAEAIESGCAHSLVKDVNGNTVGQWKLSE